VEIVSKDQTTDATYAGGKVRKGFGEVGRGEKGLKDKTTLARPRDKWKDNSKMLIK
jgi:hypothetical protein